MGLRAVLPRTRARLVLAFSGLVIGEAIAFGGFFAGSLGFAQWVPAVALWVPPIATAITLLPAVVPGTGGCTDDEAERGVDRGPDGLEPLQRAVAHTPWVWHPIPLVWHPSPPPHSELMRFESALKRNFATAVIYGALGVSCVPPTLLAFYDGALHPVARSEVVQRATIPIRTTQRQLPRESWRGVTMVDTRGRRTDFFRSFELWSLLQEGERVTARVERSPYLNQLRSIELRGTRAKQESPGTRFYLAAICAIFLAGSALYASVFPYEPEAPAPKLR